MKRLLIAGDFFPSSKDASYFETGEINRLFDDRVIDLFRNADFSIVNLVEGVLTTEDIPQKKIGPIIKASPKILGTLCKLRVSSVSLANNHITDFQAKGVGDTIKALEDVGIHHIGASVDLDTRNNSLSIKLDEKSVGIYNVSETFFNTPYVNVYDEYVVCNEIRNLKSQNDYVIVIYHGGAERCQYPSPQVRKRFHRMVDSGADFITAQHTHCIGCEEYYKDSYLLYGQGNFFFSRMNQSYAHLGLVSELIFDGGIVSIKHHFVEVSENGQLIYSPQQDFSEFKHRSAILKNRGEEDLYMEYIRANTKLKEDYLLAFRGNTFESRLMIKLFPHKYKNIIEKKFSREQYLRVLLALQSDRTGENVLSMWKNLIEKYV